MISITNGLPQARPVVQFGNKTRDAKHLLDAINQGDTEEAKKLLEKGVDPLNAPTTMFPNLLDSFGHPFLAALRRDNFELAGWMIEKYDLHPEMPMEQQWHRLRTPETTLMDEVLSMSPEALEFILQKGASPDIPSRIAWATDNTPLEVLVFSSHWESEDMLKRVELLLEYGAKDDLAAMIDKAAIYDKQLNPREQLRKKTIALLQKYLTKQQQNGAAKALNTPILPEKPEPPATAPSDEKPKAPDVEKKSK